MTRGGFNFEVRHPTDKAIRRPRRSRCNLWRFDHARAICGTMAPTRAASRSSEVKQRPRRVAGFLFGSWAAGPDDRSGYSFFPPTRFWFARSAARCTACGDRTGLSSDSSGSWSNARKPSKSSHCPPRHALQKVGQFKRCPRAHVPRRVAVVLAWGVSEVRAPPFVRQTAPLKRLRCRLAEGMKSNRFRAAPGGDPDGVQVVGEALGNRCSDTALAVQPHLKQSRFARRAASSDVVQQGVPRSGRHNGRIG